MISGDGDNAPRVIAHEILLSGYEEGTSQGWHVEGCYIPKGRIPIWALLNPAPEEASKEGAESFAYRLTPGEPAEEREIVGDDHHAQKNEQERNKWQCSKDKKREAAYARAGLPVRVVQNNSFLVKKIVFNYMRFFNGNNVCKVCGMHVAHQQTRANHVGAHLGIVYHCQECENLSTSLKFNCGHTTPLRVTFVCSACCPYRVSNWIMGCKKRSKNSFTAADFFTHIQNLMRHLKEKHGVGLDADKAYKLLRVLEEVISSKDQPITV